MVGSRCCIPSIPTLGRCCYAAGAVPTPASTNVRYPVNPNSVSSISSTSLVTFSMPLLWPTTFGHLFPSPLLWHWRADYPILLRTALQQCVSRVFKLMSNEMQYLLQVNVRVQKKVERASFNIARALMYCSWMHYVTLIKFKRCWCRTYWTCTRCCQMTRFAITQLPMYHNIKI